MQPKRAEHNIRPGIGQLTLVEHSLCPLDCRSSLVENLVHRVEYQFSDVQRKRRTARVSVFCPLGLSANDELYLWGLLALTMSQSVLDGELRATPHWCLRQLGLIDQHTRRGGRQYSQFTEAVRRLSAVSYLNDFFYDPVRAEHRRVSFGLLSYSLPRNPTSSRAWRVVWDPLFFETVQAAAGQFRFDLSMYRALDAATRRLFLFACKVFSRSRRMPVWDLEHLGVDLLGFSPTLNAADMKVKVNKCVRRLQELDVIGTVEYPKIGPRKYRVQLTRGPYFNKDHQRSSKVVAEESPVWESLIQIGFEPGPARRLIERFPLRILDEWADITQAASERFGGRFFSKSPMAYFVDSVTKASQGRRTPPDWWAELRRKESAPTKLNIQSRRVFERLRDELFAGRRLDEKPGVERLSTIGTLLTGQRLRKQ